MAASASTTRNARPLADLSGTILLAGAGKMGSALLEGWLALGLAPGNLAIVEPAPAGHLTELAARGVRLNPPRDGIGEVAAAVVAVKPQVAPEVMPVLAPLVGANTAVVSIMAGRTLRFLEAALPHAALIRAMPNTPAAIGRGITVAVANARVSREQRAQAQRALSAVGLEGFERRPVGSLSAGQFQRVLFARLILQDAAIVLLDEPFTAIDARTTRDLLDLVGRWHTAERRTVVAVLHDTEQVRQHFPRTLMIAREAIGWGLTQEVLTASNLLKARCMAESWDEEAVTCDQAGTAA